MNHSQTITNDLWCQQPGSIVIFLKQISVKLLFDLALFDLYYCDYYCYGYSSKIFYKIMINKWERMRFSDKL